MSVRDMLHRNGWVLRHCHNPSCYHRHTWCWLNPATMQPFRRGHVTFFCLGAS